MTLVLSMKMDFEKGYTAPMGMGGGNSTIFNSTMGFLTFVTLAC